MSPSRGRGRAAGVKRSLGLIWPPFKTVRCGDARDGNWPSRSRRYRAAVGCRSCTPEKHRHGCRRRENVRPMQPWYRPESQSRTEAVCRWVRAPSQTGLSAFEWSVGRNPAEPWDPDMRPWTLRKGRMQRSAGPRGPPAGTKIDENSQESVVCTAPQAITLAGSISLFRAAAGVRPRSRAGIPRCSP
jgi:hypothetical protein